MGNQKNFYMTNQEFNQFLKQIGGLTNGFFSDRKIEDRDSFDVQNGWLGLVKLLIQTLIDNGWNKTLLQCKQKFGSLRFYISSGTEKIFDIINHYQNLSQTICQECGELGKEVNEYGWISIKCNKCR